MDVRALRTAAAARTPPRLLAATSRVLHGETGPQRHLSRRLRRLRQLGRVRGRRDDAVEVTSFSALATLALNRGLVRDRLDTAGIPYDAPEPAVMHPARVLVAAEHAAAARAAVSAPAPGVHLSEPEPGRLVVWTRQVAGDRQLAGPELGCSVAWAATSVGPTPVIDFPVDAVYTWVDGTDPAWRRRRDAAWAVERDHRRNALAANASRFESRDELRFSLRSLEMYAGWVRHIFLVTDAQVPGWLRTDHPNVTVVDHRDIFPPDGAGRPTFNSHAIEARLHHVAGLADHYLYLNDDVFFGRPVGPELFFTPEGQARYFRTPATLSAGPASADDRPVDAAAKVSRDLIAREFGQDLAWKYQHVAHAQRRDVQADIEQRFADEVAHTVRSTFRHPEDVSAAASLAHALGSVTGRAVPGELAYLYCDIAERRAPIKLTRLARQRDVDMFCLNDVGAEGRVVHDPDRLLERFLTTYFPLPSSFEAPG